MLKKHYHPPPTEVIEQLSADICRQMGEAVDPSYNTPEVRWGLAAFLKLVATIQARQLSSNLETNHFLDNTNQER